MQMVDIRERELQVNSQQTPIDSRYRRLFDGWLQETAEAHNNHPLQNLIVMEMSPVEWCSIWVPRVYNVSPERTYNNGVAYGKACVLLLSYVTGYAPATCENWLYRKGRPCPVMARRHLALVHFLWTSVRVLNFPCNFVIRITKLWNQIQSHN